MPRLENLIGSLVNIVFEDGASQASKKGHIVAVDDEFVTFKTLRNSYLIRRSAIISIKTFGEGEER